MTIRVDVLEDSTIEIMRPSSVRGRNVFHKIKDLEMVMVLIRYYVAKDLELSVKNKFVSRATIDARKAFKQLQNRSRFNHGKR